MLDLIGLDCEEALMVLKMACRQSNEPVSLVSASATFHTLMSQWAGYRGMTITPEIKPRQGHEWSVTLSRAA